MAFVLTLWIVTSGLTAHALGDSPALAVALVFVGLSSLLIPLDVRRRRLPRTALLGGLAMVLVVQFVTSLRIDEPDRLVGVLGGVALGSLMMIVASRAAPGGAGLGDAAYAALAGGVLGWFGPQRVVLGVGLGLILGAVAAGPLSLAMNRDVLVPSPSVLLRPALAVGAWVALCWGDVFVGWYIA